MRGTHFIERRGARRLGAALVLSVGLATGQALADEKTNAAEGYFREGVAAMKETKYVEACAAFDASNRADPSPGTQINLGLCNEKQGKFASAWIWYSAAAALATDRGQNDRATLARKEADRVAPLVSRVVVNGKPADAKATVKLDDVEVKFGLESRVDPGTHNLEVAESGKRTYRTTVTIDKNQAGVRAVDVPPLEDDPDAVKAAAGGAQTVGPGTEHPPGATENASQRNIGLVVGGAGIIALLAAGGLQGLALIVDGKASDLNTQLGQKGCANTPPSDPVNCPSLQSAYDSKRSAASNDQTAAIITGAGGVVMIGVGVTLVLTASSKSTADRRPTLVPMVGGGTTGLGVVGSF